MLSDLQFEENFIRVIIYYSVILDFSERCLLSSISPKLQVGFCILFNFPYENSWALIHKIIPLGLDYAYTKKLTTYTASARN